ncbi:Rha family transcriptional regulator [Endozoicomonas sp. 4G]|uniref:Rha family transcriptional regulator n=1 Tax=Endozoicomonas sp. 4G TaxID=2872754 RepID=UPI001BCAC0FB|nr:Rha family transcriptional regulator [Endozoicomonas sp. 4G]
MAKQSVTHHEIAGVIEIHRNKPMVSSLKIAELFERPHKNVLAAIRRELADDISRLKLEPRDYIDARGKSQPVFWLDERQALVVMPFLGGKKSREGQRKLVDAYLYYRDAFKNPPRADLVRGKRDASRVLTDSIIDMRSEHGKDTTAVHYMSEQKLCNWAVNGAFKALDESSLSNEDLELLRLVRERNAALIAAEIDYPERKARLAQYAIRQRTKLIATAPGDQAL